MRNGRQMPLSKAETARPTILVWHRSCGVPREETVVAPMSVACTPHDPVLHMIMFMWVTHEHESFSSPDEEPDREAQHGSLLAKGGYANDISLIPRRVTCCQRP